jgi:ferredoxin-fold anticodon binding domain-containing protein
MEGGDFNHHLFFILPNHIPHQLGIHDVNSYRVFRVVELSKMSDMVILTYGNGKTQKHEINHGILFISQFEYF